MIRVDDLSRVSWCCVHFGKAAEVTPDLRAQLESAGIVCFDLDGEGLTTRDDLRRALAQALRLPDDLGISWDGVIDCLRDLGDRVPGEGYVLFVHQAEWLWRRNLAAMGDLVEVWLTAAEESAHDGVPLHLVLASAADFG